MDTMEWTQRDDDTWTLAGNDGNSKGTVRYRDGSWWTEPPAGDQQQSLDQPARISNAEYQEALADLREPLGPFETVEQAKDALERDIQA